MKEILLGLTLLASLSSFATDNISEFERGFIEGKKSSETAYKCSVEVYGSRLKIEADGEYFGYGETKTGALKDATEVCKEYRGGSGYACVELVRTVECNKA